MKPALLIQFLVALQIVVSAHPGVGIVEDSRGNIFYTDLKQVWKISPDRKMNVAVKNVHTHELYIDEHDNLFGEHLWYNGEQANTWGHFVWKLSSNGSFSKVIPDKEGFLENYSFVRDHFGHMFWAERSGDCQKVICKNADSSTTKLGDQCFHDIRWMTSTAEGVVYVVDFQDLKKIDKQGRIKTVASQVADRKVTQSTIANQNSVMGVWDDKQGNLYAAVASARAVKKFTPTGKEEIAFETLFPWAPSGGIMDSKGILWVLEFSPTNAVRVEKVMKDGQTSVFEE